MAVVEVEALPGMRDAYLRSMKEHRPTARVLRTSWGARACTVLLLTLAACPIPVRRPPSELPTEPVPVPTARGVSLAHEPQLQASFKAPSRVPYVVDALGIGGQPVAVRLTNTGARAVDVQRFRVAFSATRDGVRFPCKEHVGGAMRVREPSSLEPGQSFVFERDLDCSMPIPGTWDVGLYVALKGATESDDGDFVGTFSLEVVQGQFGPKPYPSRPGLYVVMTGPRATQPFLPEAWARGDYHVVVAFVNGSNRTVPVGPARLAFLTYKQGSPLPCSGQVASLALPGELAPGAIHLAPAPVACAPAEEGRYEIVGKLTLAESGEGIDIGRVVLKVKNDPLLFDPAPSRSSDWPASRWTK